MKAFTKAFTRVSFGQGMWCRTAHPSKIIISASCVLVDTSTFNFIFNVDLPLGYLASPVSVNNEVGNGANS